MTARKQKTSNVIQGALISTLKDKLIEESIIKDKIIRFRGLLLQKDGHYEVANMLKKYPNDVPFVNELISDKKMIVRMNAINALQDINEMDITIVIPSLVKALDDKVDEVRVYAALALLKAASKGADISIAIPALVNALRDRSLDVRNYSVCGLAEASKRGADIAFAIPSLMEAIEDENSNKPEIRFNSLYAVNIYAKKMSTINEATILSLIQTNMKMLGDKDFDTRYEAAEFLAIYLNEKNKDYILDLLVNALRNGSGWTQVGAASLLCKVAAKGTDISHLIPALTKALGNRYNDVREQSSEALGFCIEKENDVSVALPALVNALGDSEEDVRFSVGKTLLKAAEKGIDFTNMIPTLVNALGGDEEGYRENILINISNRNNKVIIFDLLLKKLLNENENEKIQQYAARIIANTDLNGAELSYAIPFLLIKLIKNKNWKFRRDIVYFLANAIKNYYEPHLLITKTIIDFTNSHEFMVEAEKNSEYYITSICLFDQFLRTIRESESTPQEVSS